MKKKDDNAPTDVVEDVEKKIEHHQDPRIVGSGRTKQAVDFVLIVVFLWIQIKFHHENLPSDH